VVTRGGERLRPGTAVKVLNDSGQANTQPPKVSQSNGSGSEVSKSNGK
jgi:hypothetical protein